jgi:hypothetical protein
VARDEHGERVRVVRAGEPVEQRGVGIWGRREPAQERQQSACRVAGHGHLRDGTVTNK